jgi:hypothetical protein
MRGQQSQEAAGDEYDFTFQAGGVYKKSFKQLFTKHFI